MSSLAATKITYALATVGRTPIFFATNTSSIRYFISHNNKTATSGLKSINPPARTACQRTVSKYGRKRLIRRQVLITVFVETEDMFKCLPNWLFDWANLARLPNLNIQKFSNGRTTALGWLSHQQASGTKLPASLNPITTYSRALASIYRSHSSRQNYSLNCSAAHSI